MSFKAVAFGIGSILLVGALSVGGLYWQGFLGQIEEGQRAKIARESFAYKRGMENELGNYWLEYQSADTAGKAALSAMVKQKFAGIDTGAYPDHLQDFLRTVGAR